MTPPAYHNHGKCLRCKSPTGSLYFLYCWEHSPRGSWMLVDVPSVKPAP
jgi:hypothetical protein